MNLQDPKHNLPSSTRVDEKKRFHKNPEKPSISKAKTFKIPDKREIENKKAANMKKEPARKSNPSLAITKQQTHSPFLSPPLIQREHFRVSIDDGALSSQGHKFDL